MKVHRTPKRFIDDEAVIVFDGVTFHIWDGDGAIATALDPRELSKWAFANGALTVRHAYDLGRAP